MARDIVTNPNTTPPDGDFPYGRIRNRTSSQSGTKVNERTYGDIQQFFARMMDQADVVYNGQPDNEYSGFQLFEAMMKLIGKTIIPIGSWDIVDDGRLKDIDLNDYDIDPTKVARVTAWIRNDGGFDFGVAEYSNFENWYHSSMTLPSNGTSGYTAFVSGVITHNRATNIVTLQARVNSTLDNGTEFDNPAIERGYLIVETTL